MNSLTVKKLRELLAGLPDDASVSFHAYEKGCCLHSYVEKDVWTYPKGAEPEQVKAFVMNPGDTYDGRRPPDAKTPIENIPTENENSNQQSGSP